MDGLRKVPENIPNKEILEKNLHKPLTSVPDPFKKFKSFGEHNNKMLKDFLDKFKFDYIFKSKKHSQSPQIGNHCRSFLEPSYNHLSLSILLPRNQRFQVRFDLVVCRP